MNLKCFEYGFTSKSMVTTDSGREGNQILSAREAFMPVLIVNTITDENYINRWEICQPENSANETAHTLNHYTHSKIFVL